MYHKIILPYRGLCEINEVCFLEDYKVKHMMNHTDISTAIKDQYISRSRRNIISKFIITIIVWKLVY